MKTVLLNDEGYTADGDWRLVKVEPTDDACYEGLKARTTEMQREGIINPSKATYMAMIASSPSPVLADAVPVGYISREYLKLSAKVESKSCVFISHKRDETYIPLFTAPPAPALQVWFGSMPESNGKTNWTAILHRGDMKDGICIERSEYKDRVRYEADRMRWMIGELPTEPDILQYDAELQEFTQAVPADVQQRIAELEAAEAELQKELENQKPPSHKGATHCENCGCTWLDDGLNPLGCPYCKGESK